MLDPAASIGSPLGRSPDANPLLRSPNKFPETIVIPLFDELVVAYQASGDACEFQISGDNFPLKEWQRIPFSLRAIVHLRDAEAGYRELSDLVMQSSGVARQLHTAFRPPGPRTLMRPSDAREVAQRAVDFIVDFLAQPHALHPKEKEVLPNIKEALEGFLKEAAGSFLLPGIPTD